MAYHVIIYIYIILFAFKVTAQNVLMSVTVMLMVAVDITIISPQNVFFNSKLTN